MSRAWRSPWPQWRSHWHVLHAWPASAQALVLVLLGLLLTAGVSALYSQEAWQSQWTAEEDAVAWQSQMAQLQPQLQAHQQMVAALQGQAHPSGLDLPAWQSVPSPGEDSSIRTHWVLLAREHGLQAPATLDENSTVWVGPWSYVQAAWQRLPQSHPHHAIDAFELSVLPETGHLQLNVTWTARSATATVSQHPFPNKAGGPLRSEALKVSWPPPNTSTDDVLHNPFDEQGLRMVLPRSAQQAAAGALRGIPLSNLRWLGMLQQAGAAQTLVAHAGQIRQVHVGQAMGQDFGEVVLIAADHLLLREWHVNTVGQWQMQTTRFPDKGSP